MSGSEAAGAAGGPFNSALVQLCDGGVKGRFCVKVHKTYRGGLWYSLVNIGQFIRGPVQPDDNHHWNKS